MESSGSVAGFILGYLTYVEIPTHGLVGGYLLVNQRARPLEFHCTAPVQVTRAQEILFGRSLPSMLYCDQVGQALIQKSSRRADILLTDELKALDLSHVTSIPVGYVEPEVGGANSSPPSFVCEGIQFTMVGGSDDADNVVEKLKTTIVGWDVMEPFDRIQAAIQEAQRAAA